MELQPQFPAVPAVPWSWSRFLGHWRSLTLSGSFPRGQSGDFWLGWVLFQDFHLCLVQGSNSGFSSKHPDSTKELGGKKSQTNKNKETNKALPNINLINIKTLEIFFFLFPMIRSSAKRSSIAAAAGKGSRRELNPDLGEPVVSSEFSPSQRQLRDS